MYEDIFRKRIFAVAGASRHPSKFGSIVYRFLREAGYEVYAVNPNTDRLEDDRCYDTVLDLPEKPDVVVTVTQPWVTSTVLGQCLAMGIPVVWMQPGSEPRQGIVEAQSAGVKVVRACIMVEHSQLRS